MIENSLKAFLVSTKYCDVENSEIQQIAREFNGRYKDKVELAKNLFYFVRDSTVYRVGHWTKKASETLHEKGGTCTNNANLLVALLRAVNIPSGYGVMDVIGPEYFGPVVLSQLARNVSYRSKHVYCYVHLNDRWIKCDPSDDEPLSINTRHLNPQSQIVEWNGLNDSMLKLNPSHILSDKGPLANIDSIIAKRMKYRRYIPIFIGNLYIQFLREQGKNIRAIVDLGKNFDAWLYNNHKIVFCFYKTFFVFESIVYRLMEWRKFKITSKI